MPIQNARFLKCRSLTGMVLAAACLLPPAYGLAADSPPAAFTRLTPLPAPKIVGAAEEYPGGRYRAVHLLDGNDGTEYASHGKGAETFVEFDFGAPVAIAAFLHRDRNDIATVAESELTFLDAENRVLGVERAQHVNLRSGVTAAAFERATTARRLRWRPTKSALAGTPCLGGAEIAFYTPAEKEPLPRGVAVTPRPASVLEKRGTQLVQPLRFDVQYPYREPCEATLEIDGCEPRAVPLKFGRHEVNLVLPEVVEPRTVRTVLKVGGQIAVQSELRLEPVRRLTVYILPHSHVDIGYTELQNKIEQKQMSNLARAIELARATADYPEGARYKWNVEVLWAVDSYLRQASAEQRREFLEAVRSGQVGLQAMYGNELTGLCRPEELMQLFEFATRLGRECGVTVDNAMISDVPGYTWGIVSAMAQAGVKYFSIAPNCTDRIGHTRAAWENKPFYWIGPSGQDKVLCSLPYFGYALSHLTPPERKTPRMLELAEFLRAEDYPYEVVYIRWSGYGDNAVPDETLPDWVKEWNERYAWPRLIIATASEAFQEFERRYGDQLPQATGDWTPYWEDGAGSTSRETALNRASADRLVQADALFAMLAPERWPAEKFAEAWRNVLLYSEHTWGAHCSISRPDDPFTTDQWRVKQAFALDADRQSRELLAAAISVRPAVPPPVSALDVWNTTQWPRTDLVILPKDLALKGDTVCRSDGKLVPSQRLASGELAFLAQDVPPFGAQRFQIDAEEAKIQGSAMAEAACLSTSSLKVEMDAESGAIRSLRTTAVEAEFVDPQSAVAINDFRYVLGTDTQAAEKNGPVQIRVVDAGPLVATLRIESDAPGCVRLIREVRVIDGLDRVELVNHVDRKPVREKDAVHFGFGFHVPDGTVRMETPWAVVRPNQDQLTGACRNWFTVQRWADVSNADRGITWAPLDAPLMETGAMTANLLGSVPLDQWLTTAIESPTIYSWAQNNHWHTNYKADQPGVTTFRYYLRPHAGGYNGADAARFGIESTRPLIPIPAAETDPVPPPLLSVDSPGVIVETLKPSQDGRAYVLRLFDVSGQGGEAQFRWREPKPKAMWLSDLSERPGKPIAGSVQVPAFGAATVRVDR